MLRRKRDLWWLAPVLVIPAVVALLIWAVIYEIRHPCIRYREDTCTSTECTWHQRPGDMTSPCLHWESKTYPCKTCVERKP
jgi:hypothetical protein